MRLSKLYNESDWGWKSRGAEAPPPPPPEPEPELEPELTPREKQQRYKARTKEIQKREKQRLYRAAETGDVSDELLSKQANANTMADLRKQAGRWSAAQKRRVTQPKPKPFFPEKYFPENS